MNLRFLLHRRYADSVPLLPVSEYEDTPSPMRTGGKRSQRAVAEREERLERLLTPTELDLVQHHRL
ncbi:hypothetical protein BJY24_003117 [Nocardia transvalensis]|uniref:Uncharacterized protein n=1 Tax=Nocardia transvalensis TaxID=37333 RepID=A0A7W9UJ05_9NOCA|nr:hypothetical protein [Nocardia transvalensis]MBB5914250.1 hypothetical protein [Nocardia transvalensis]